MAERDNEEGPYIVWKDWGYDGWGPTSYDTLDEAVRAPKDRAFVITRVVEFDVVERPNPPPPEAIQASVAEVPAGTVVWVDTPWGRQKAGGLAVAAGWKDEYRHGIWNGVSFEAPT